MTPDEFRVLGHELIERIAAYREQLADKPVSYDLNPGEVRGKLPPKPPEQGGGVRSFIDQLDTVVEPALTHWQHPRFFGYFPANAELASVLGDLLSSGFGQLGLNWRASPALTELEEHACDWMRQLFGLPSSFRGVIQDTASTSTLVALLCARERATGHAQVKGGMTEVGAPLTVYASEQAHSSVEKAALLAGFGRKHIRFIATDEAHALRADLLKVAVARDVAAGLTPCAVVATTGTTATTAVDPVDRVAFLAQDRGLWLHVDAAMAGSAMMLPECRWMWQGVEQADSIVVNAHKWLGAVFDCSLYFVKDADHLVRVMSTDPSYLRTDADGEAPNYRDWGIPLGRRFRALKLLLLLYSEGAAGLRSRLKRDLANAQWLKEQVEADPNWELMAPVTLQTVCVRHVPRDLPESEADAHTLDWAARVNGSGEAFVTPAQLHGRWMVRVSIGSLPTELADVEALWALMRRSAHSLL